MVSDAPNLVPVWISLLMPILVLLGAIVQWLAEFRWSSRYIASKDETIDSLRVQLQERQATHDSQLETLRSQMEALREQTYPKLAEILLSTKQGYDAFVNLLEGRVKSLEEENGRLTRLVEEERRKGSSRVAELERELDTRAAQTELLKEQVASLRSQEPVPATSFGPGTLPYWAWRTAVEGRYAMAAAQGLPPSVLYPGVLDDLPRTHVSGGSALGGQRPTEARTDKPKS